MDVLGGNLVQKAQNSAFRRWFSKPKHIAEQIGNTPGDEHGEAGLRVDEPESREGEVEPHSFNNHVDRSQYHENGQKLEAPSADKTSVVFPSEDEPRLNSPHDQHPDPKTDESGELPLGEYIPIGKMDEEDYTQTVGGIVKGFDGYKSCPVLLLTYELSTKIQEMLLFQRVILKEERHAQARLEALTNFEAALARETENHRYHIEAGEPGQGYEDDDEVEPNRMESLRDELENLERLSKNTQVDKAVIESNLIRRRNLLQSYQADVNQELEEAFIQAEAIEPASEDQEEDIQVPEMTVKEEYQKLLAQMQELQGVSVVEKPFQTADERQPIYASVPTPEQQARMEASKALWEAKENLQHARVQFSEKEKLRERDLQSNIQAELRGEAVADASVEAFDLRWVVRFREVTAGLLEAEKELSRARAVAKQAGLGLEYENQSSCFPDDAQDGQPELMSNEIDSPETFAGDPRMISWMESLADSVDPDFSEPAEVDDWGSREEVDVSDSASAVAEGTERRRIDAWRQVCRVSSKQS